MCFWMDGASRRRGVGTPVRLALYPRECQRLNAGVASDHVGRSGLGPGSRLGLGANTFGWTAPGYGVRGARRVRRRGRPLRRHRRLLRRGQSFASASETIIGEWFAARGRRDDVVLATKVGSLPSRPGSRPRTSRRRRRVAAAPADRPHRPLLGAQGRPGHPAGGDPRRVRRARARGQGAGDRGVQLLGGAARVGAGDLREGGPGRLRRAAAALQPRGAGRVRDHAAAGARRARPDLRAVLRAGPRLPHREVPAGRPRSTARARQGGVGLPRRPWARGARRARRRWRPRTACRWRPSRWPGSPRSRRWWRRWPARGRSISLPTCCPTLSLTLADAEVAALSAASRL